MAINKVINCKKDNHGVMRNRIEYVLQSEKVTDGYVLVTGPYAPEIICCDEIYKSWLDEKKLWDKDSGRMTAHNVISFHKEENIIAEQVLEIGRLFAEEFFAEFQCVIGVHQDKDHLHCHIVTNTVSYIDGHKLHQSKHDLEHQKEYTNKLCLDRGLTIAQKGYHFDGSVIERGEVIAWSKDKYNLLLNDTKKSYVAECAIAIMEVVPQSASREEFISGMEERGWSVQWEDSRKHIVFQNEDGNKVRDTNIERTFAGMEVNKEALTYEFAKQNEKLELERYYAVLESAVTGINTAKAVRDNTAVTVGTELHHDGAGYTEEERETPGYGEDTDSLIREVEADINDSRSQSRTVILTENQSVADNEQSVTREAERRLEEQRWAVEQERAEAARRKISHSHGWEH